MRIRTLSGAVFILLLATFLRFHLLEAQSFWNDEGNSARLSERSLPAIVEGTASDIHPPLYYLLLRAWRELAGETEFGLRAFSAFAGILTVAITMALARSLSRYPVATAFVAGLLVAASPVLVYYSQETRMYMLLALLAVASTWVLLEWLRRRAVGRPTWFATMAYVLLSAAGLYTHYFYPAVLGAQGLLMLIWLVRPAWLIAEIDGVRWPSRRRGFGVWLGLTLLAAVAYLPWMPIFLRQIGGRDGVRQSLVDFVTQTGHWLALGNTIHEGTAVWAPAAALLLVLTGLIAGGRRAIAPLLMAIIPLALMYLVGATDPAFLKFILLAVPFLCVVAGLSWRLPARMWLLPGILVLVLLAGSTLSLRNLYSDPSFARADYRLMAQRIEADAHPGAAVILNGPNQWEVFTYYHRDGLPVYPMPRGRPDPAILVPELERIAASHERIYVLFWGEQQRDPEGVIERWLDENTFKASEEWVGDVRFAEYAVAGGRSGETIASNTQFVAPNGDTLRLHTYQISPISVRRGDVTAVTLVWESDKTPAQRYKVFLHLLDGSGNLVAQRDAEPVGGSRPTTTWQPGERITDNHGLIIPSDLAPGDYILRLGLYDAFDPVDRLSVLDADGHAFGDTLHLATIQVRE